MPRVFIAVSAPGNDAIEGVVATLSGMGRAVKAVALNNLHLTLRFIGQVEEGQMEPIASAVHDAVADHRHAELPLIGLGAFPNRQRPQTIWIGIRGQEPLATIVQDIELALIDVGIEPDETLLTRISNELRSEVLRTLSMPLARRVCVEVVAELRCDHDLVALLSQRLRKNLLRVPDAVGVRGVEEVDPEVKGPHQQGDSLILVYLAPPVGAYRPGAEANL